MENNRNGPGSESSDSVSMVWQSEIVGHRQPVRWAGSIVAFGRLKQCENSVGDVEPAELSTGGRQGKAAHPLHLAMRSKNDHAGGKSMIANEKSCITTQYKRVTL